MIHGFMDGAVSIHQQTHKKTPNTQAVRVPESYLQLVRQKKLRYIYIKQLYLFLLSYGFHKSYFISFHIFYASVQCQFHKP